MTAALVLEQVLNGVQLGVMLFLLAAGLTLIFGIMNFITLVHGSLYMLGAFFAATFLAWTHSFLAAAVLAVAATFAVGVLLDAVALRHLYRRSHLDQVLGTFGLMLFFNDLTLLIWGPEPYFMAMPSYLAGTVPLFAGTRYPVYRLAITGAEMLSGLGGNVRALMVFVFGLGAALAGFAGFMAAPLVAVQVGMGDALLITAFVVVVIGGIGSVRGAFVSAILVGLVDTMGRALLPYWLGYSAGPAVASMAIYLLMALVLLVRPTGLIAARQ